MKKCPVCNSTRIKIKKDSFACDRCGYVNRKNKKSEVNTQRK